MSVFAVVLTALSVLVALIWVSRHVMIIVEGKKGFTLTDAYPAGQRDWPFVSVVVAAKDEEANIATCVRTMLAQDYPNFELIVCNDRSTDRTAEIVAEIAAEDPRLRLANITQLPEGWGGKNNAMQTGIAQSKGEWICMIDADCEQTSKLCLRSAVAYALDNQSGLLSVLPTLLMRGFWENVVQPVCSGVMMIWFHPDKVNSPKYPNAYANGAFMLMKRSVYQAIGTHQAVRTCVNEDMHIAARVKQAGLNLRVVRNDGLYTCRMYTSLPQIVRGWSRIFFGTFVTLRRVLISLAVLVIVSMLPYLAAPLGFAMYGLGAAPAGWWLACGIAAAAAAVLQLTVIFRFYSLIDACKWMFWTYPIGCVVVMIALFNAIGKFRRGAKLVWRNTSYDSGKLSAGTPTNNNPPK